MLKSAAVVAAPNPVASFDGRGGCALIQGVEELPGRRPL